ncbi:OLC1v1026613C1 [Oldenlandia corymbosa var. corymbosa]|uniref:OLC1v1026613C1 n=1 Tax=Oldenlandia corymbosa var. corymbosa TaxID=529605 RepID=A0AAV1C982_OLDCO|nr:OLC1v1026613C1 [Oldenlandia corymbosa var. corymbosa]
MSTPMKTMTSSIEINLDGDVLHEIFRDRPHNLATICPSFVEGFELHDGEWGKAGTVFFFKFNHDGQKLTAKEVVEAIDDAKKSMTTRVIEGDILALYKTFVISYEVDQVGENKHLVTWTFQYEKVNESIPEPDSLMDFCLNATKEIEAYHLK